MTFTFDDLKFIEVLDLDINTYNYGECYINEATFKGIELEDHELDQLNTNYPFLLEVWLKHKMMLEYDEPFDCRGV